MYYSAIGILAVIILLIENLDVLINRRGAFGAKEWKMYRFFLFSVLVYYITDIIWGVLEYFKLAQALYIDTSIYFIATAAGFLFWSMFVVNYLSEIEGIGRGFLYICNGAAAVVILISITNIFNPILFTVDENCVYEALWARYVVLAIQIVTLILVSVYTLSANSRKQNTEGKIQRYRIIGLCGFIMAIFLFGQVWFPYLPLYSVAYMLGTSMLHSFVIRAEKEEYRLKLVEASKSETYRQALAALLDNMPALTFTKDAKTGEYVACNQKFAEYAHKESPEGVVGLTDAQIFDPETAAHFEEDDRMALSMDEPFVFFEDVPDAEGNQRQFQTTKLKFTSIVGRQCILGMCQDVTDLVSIQRENATTKEAYEQAKNRGVIFTHIAQALAQSYSDLYYVNVETGEYTEYGINKSTGALFETRRGEDFFESLKSEVEIYVYPEDWDMYLRVMDREALMDSLDRNGSVVLTYRLLVDGEPTYMTMKVSRMVDDHRFIILGVTNVDEEMRWQKAAERIKEEQIAYSRLNALAGDVLCVYLVDPVTGHYREFSSAEGYQSLRVPKEGEDFFGASRERMEKIVYPVDLERVMDSFTWENIQEQVEKDGSFAMTYRLVINDKPRYVQLRAAMIHENDGTSLIVGLMDVDAQVRQEKEFERRLSQAQSKVNIDPLTGVKNRRAYLDEEAKLDQMIIEKEDPKFAVIILDINDLKKINDTEGHQAGDQYIRDACKIICTTFKHSP
ncbi:MAG: diguanylate cyclase, partial [Lachnospiraceae bacterium]|nr:diguanylate cyclase [Lachnospiraceae bacterium]